MWQCGPLANPATQKVGVDAVGHCHGCHRNAWLATRHHYLRLELVAVASPPSTCCRHSFVGIHVSTYELMDTMLLSRARLDQDGMAGRIPSTCASRPWWDALVDYVRRYRRLHDRLLFRAGPLAPHVALHGEHARHMFQLLGDVLTDALHLATARAGGALRLVTDLATRQARRQRCAFRRSLVLPWRSVSTRTWFVNGCVAAGSRERAKPWRCRERRPSPATVRSNSLRWRCPRQWPTRQPEANFPAADIRIDMRRDDLQVSVSWPSSAAADCGAWLRELLR